MIYNLKTLISCPDSVFYPKEQFTWFEFDLFHTRRFKLYCEGNETPYFVDYSSLSRHQYIKGYKVSVWGSGMGETVTRIDGSTYQIAGFKGTFKTLKEGKEKAIMLVMK